MKIKEIAIAYLLKPRPKALGRIECMESERHSHCADEKEKKKSEWESGKTRRRRRRPKLGDLSQLRSRHRPPALPSTPLVRLPSPAPLAIDINRNR